MDTSREAKDVDVENNHPPAPQKQDPTAKGMQVLEAAALLALWSVLVINEGAIRFIRETPSEGLFADPPDGQPTKFVPVLGGILEVVFGIVGLSIGTGAFILRWYSTAVTKMGMIVQTLFGYYVFVVYVFVVPAMQASNLSEPLLEGMSVSSSRFLISLGVLTSFHFCLALQGGQFVFMARLVCAATGENFLMQKTGNSMRSVFWNANFALSGLWTLISGSLVNAQVGGGRLETPYVSPPNVGTVTGFTIFVGLLMMVWGMVGIVMGLQKIAPSWYFVGTGVVYLFALLNFGIAQFGTFAGPGAGGPVALHNGLVFMVVFMGPYFVLQTKRDETQES